ncbi:MAG: FAD-binding oxidoreductase [Rhodospirillales bacterium]|nr:FAD-binding oxidoreductase [Rhodospirillales bacterium]
MSIFADGFTTDPYWWDAAPPEAAPTGPLPETTDVAIIGSGFCGLAAALELARNGVRVDVLEAGPLGIGASSRSGGMVSSGQKLVLKGALDSFTPEKATEALEDSRATFEFLQTLIGREQLDADLQICGRFFGAYTPAHFTTLQRHAELLQSKTGVQARILSRAEQQAEIGSDFYHGGMLVEEYGGLHPSKYNRALRSAARGAGAHMHNFARVESWTSENGGVTVQTARGVVRAKHLMVATNGYTAKELPWFQRRVVPVTAFIMATEPLAPGVMDAILPKRRMVSDTRRELSFYRPSPDHTRILFGGRPTAFVNDEREAAVGLRARMVQVWPQLADVKVSHAWRGNVAMTFDQLPHLGQEQGVHYALGCNGNGVALMSWMGHQTALRILGRQNRPSAFENRPFPSMPGYHNRAWFLPLVSAGYHFRDFLDRPAAFLQERSLRRA